MKGVLRAVRGIVLACVLCASLLSPSFALAQASPSSRIEAQSSPLSGGKQGAAATVENPSEQTDIPPVVGLDLSSAIASLKAAGFAVQVQGPSSDTARVVAQNPSGRAALGTTIVVTTQEEMASVPDVMDMHVPAAIAMLKKAGFGVQVTGDSTATSLVIDQNPQGSAPPGSIVSITGKEFGESSKPTLAQIDLLPYTTDAHGQWVTEMDRTPLGSTDYRLDEGIKDKGGRVRLMVQASWSDGRMFKQSDPGWRPLSEAGGQDIQWTTSNGDVATVDSTGVVSAVGDGDAVITATAAGGVSSTMAISVIGQNGAFVTGARIVDEQGEAYGTSYIEISDIQAGARQFFVRLSYSDGATLCNAPQADDCSAEASAAIATTCTWAISSSDVGSVNAASGFFVPAQDGRAQILVTATGGDPNANHGMVTASVSVDVNTGKFSDGNAPSSQLLVQVEYEKLPGVVGKTETFSIDQLKSIQNTQATYTFTRSQGKYVTDTAQGIYLISLLDYMGIKAEEVSDFRFSANDGANPGAISANFLFGATRYYYPFANFGSDVGATAVQPMLAYADSWKEGGSCEPNTELNAGTCLRLMFGSRGMADNSTALSVKYINTMKVVLSGAPPIGWGSTDEPSGGGGNPDPGGSGAGPGSDPGPGGDSSTDQPGSGGEPGQGDGQQGAGGSDRAPGTNKHFAAAGPASSDGGASADRPGSGKPRGFDDENPASHSLDDQSADQARQNSAAAPDDGGRAAGEGSRWQVYEMMSKGRSDVDPIILGEPFEPYAVPLAGAAAAFGAATSGLLFLKRWDGKTACFESVRATKA